MKISRGTLISDVTCFSVLPRISQRRGGVGVAKWNALVGVNVSNVGVVI